MSFGQISEVSEVSGNSESVATLPGPSEPSLGAAVATATASGGTIPVFFFFFTIFAEGAIWSPSTLFCFRTGRWLLFSLGFLFYGRFWAGDTSCAFNIVI